MLPHPGHLTLIPTFHLIAVGHTTDNEADVLLRLVAYNGAVADHLDEKFSDIQNNLSNSKLLHSFAEGQFNMCYGLAKLPRRTQVKLGNQSSSLNFGVRNVWSLE